MMKLALLVLALAAFANAQNRPYYAQRPVGVPEMLDQFKPRDGLGNRIGDDEEEKTPLKAEEGIGGDPYLTPRLQDFPREHQPFWYLNSKQIMEHRGQRVPEAKPAEVETPAVADPTERRPTPQRRPVKGPVRQQTPDVEEDEEEEFSERQLGPPPPPPQRPQRPQPPRPQPPRPQPPRRRPVKLPPKPAVPEYEDLTDSRLGGGYENPKRPSKTPLRRPTQTWQFEDRA